MTILFFTRLFYPHIGGVEKHVMEIAKRMKKDGHTVNIVTENNDWSTREKINSISIYRMDVGPDDTMKKFRIWMWIEKHKQLITEADVIHCHDVFFWYFPFRFFFIHKSVYTTFHGYETIYPPAKKALVIRKLSEIISFGNICIGDYIRKWYGTKPTYISYGGIEKLSQEKLKIKKDIAKLKIIFVGRIDKDTGITMYIKALELLKKRNIAFSFDVYGDGSLRKIAEEYGTVHGFTDTVDHAMKNADIIFASSYLSILDAFSLKKPVFAIFENPLKKDYLEMTPFAKWIVITNSSDKLAEKIVAYTKKTTEPNRMIEEAYNWVQQQTWDKVVDTYYLLWKI